jgi:fatty acid desaturase
MDPDIEHPLLVLTPSQRATKKGVRLVIGRYQALLYYPASLAIQGIGIHISHIKMLLRSSGERTRELGLICAHILLLIIPLALLLPAAKVVAFLAINQAVFGLYLGSTFAPNHKGMPVYAPNEVLGYFRRQVTSSRNIQGGWVMDVLFGGLNRQIEHHLFPSMPRPSLRAAAPMVRQYCAEVGVPYVEVGVWHSARIVLRYLRQVGRGGDA